MSSLLYAELAATCNALGYFDGSKYYIDTHCRGRCLYRVVLIDIGFTFIKVPCSSINSSLSTTYLKSSNQISIVLVKCIFLALETES
jgi:hypothetical protein